VNETVRWHAIVLAAGRGPLDPMASAYGVTNKCVIPVGGVPMLRRIVDALLESPRIASISVSIENDAIGREAIGDAATSVAFLPSAASAPASVLKALATGGLRYPVLVTTGDHALLTPEMIEFFCSGSEHSGADFTAGLARAETILAAHPQSIRTFFRLGADRVSGCNLFSIRSEAGRRVLERWQYLEQNRKRPWRLVMAFGLRSLLLYLAGALTLDRAFAMASAKLGLDARPVIMPFAEAAIDVDKPADKDLAESILAARGASIPARG